VADTNADREPEPASPVLPAPSARQRLTALIDAGPRLVVLRAPHGYGKTALLRHWADSHRAGRTALLLSGRLGASTGFWSELGQALDPSAPIESEQAALLRVRPMLEAVERPLALLVDDFYAFRDPGLAEELLEMLDACPLVRLIVAVRARHAIETAARSRSRAVLALTIDDLAWEAEEAAELARSRGMRLEPSSAHLIVEATGGWPAMVDKVLRHLAKRPVTADRVRETLQLTDDGLTAWLLDELVSSEHAHVLAQLAIAEHLTVGAARFLTGDEKIDEALDDLVADGLLVRRFDPDADEQVFEFPMVIRRLALAGMTRASAGQTDESRPRLAQWFAAQSRPEAALVQAAAEKDWEFIAQLFESSWAQLYHVEEEILVDAMRQLPEEVARAYPKAHAVRYLVLGTAMSPAELPHPMARSFLDVVELARKMGAVNAVEIAVAEYIVLRRSGRYRDAVRMGKVSHYLAEIIGSHVPDYIVPMVPMARLQLALTFELAGRAKDAAEELAIALAALESLSDVDRFESNQITGVLSAKAAMEGDLVASRVWSDREVPVDGMRPRVWLMPFVPSGHQIARAIRAVDSLDAAAAEEPLVQLRLQETRDELWAMSAWAQARHDLAWSDPISAIRSLDFARLRHREWHNEESAAQAILLAAEVDVLLADGSGNRAFAHLLKTDSKHPAVQLARGRLAYLTGQTDDAAARARDILRSRSAPDRWRLEATILSAGAIARSKGVEASLPSWRNACALAARMGNPLLPFAMADAALRDRAAEHVDALAEIVRECRRRGVDAIFPESVSIIRLTAREYAVLEKLAADVPLAVLARAHFVSEATVKTQIRSLYAKLGVHSRTEAVALAEAEGLL
jgi:LuxR family transcriptional regulator, maltose regulon positive regulatory protein